MRSKNIVFVHGLFGWGPEELGGLRYWGDALAQFGGVFETHEAKCGPISSFHDRACEVFAQIKGTQVDYGENHSKEAGHARTSRNYSKGFVPDWSADNQVILIGHSAGAQTCLQLQQLLAQDFWKCGSAARWVEAIVSIAGVNNGSTLTYLAVCAPATGKVKHAPSIFIQMGLDILKTIQNSLNLVKNSINIIKNIFKLVPNKSFIDLYLDQWPGGSGPIDNALFKKLDESNFVNGDDYLAFDLSLQGCCKANEKFRTQTGTYYLSIVTSKTDPQGNPLGFEINPLLLVYSLTQRFTI